MTWSVKIIWKMYKEKEFGINPQLTWRFIYCLSFLGGKTAFYNPVIILDNYFVLLEYAILQATVQGQSTENCQLICEWISVSQIVHWLSYPLQFFCVKWASLPSSSPPHLRRYSSKFFFFFLGRWNTGRQSGTHS